MLKFEDVAMQTDNRFKNIEILNHGQDFKYDNFLKQSTLVPFNDLVVKYLNALSKTINQDSRLKLYPDVASFAFFCRRANINKLKKYFTSVDIHKTGRGLIFHIAPSNVPINFAFSLITGLLAGNSNIVKVSSNHFEQTDIIIDSIIKLSETLKHSDISKKIVLIRYDKSKSSITKMLSYDCDIRIIWGGDTTINDIRKHLLNPKAFDVTFPDRYSMCIISAEKYLNDSNYKNLAKGFFNDTFLFDQNACTAPHLIVWLGSKKNINSGKTIFWNELLSIVEKNYDFKSIYAIDKLTSLFNQAINMEKIKLQKTDNNLIWRVKLKNLRDDLDEYRCNYGYFLEYDASSLDQLSKIVNKKYQTISYYGFSKNELSSFLKKIKPKGIDRIVPIGRTMDFSLIWDGYNMIESLSRRVEVL